MLDVNRNFKNDPEVLDLMQECYKSTKVIAKTMFPERFYAPFSQLHDQIFELIDSGAPRVAIAAPRGMGKTSIVALALAAKKILFQDSKFFVYVSNSANSGELQTENLKHELISNKNIKAFFGDVKARGSQDIDESFSKRAWVTNGGTLIYPRGSGQQIRGILYHNSRPDLIVVDDLEATDTIQNEEIRAARKIWFNADLLKAVSRVDKNWQIVYIDTLKHEDALLQDLIDSPDWESLRLELCDDDYKSNAPEFMSDEEVMKEVEYHRNNNLMDVFYREFRNIPISKEDADFKPEYFKYYEEADLIKPKSGKSSHILNVVLCDPAKTVKMHSADSAVVCWGVDRESHAMYFRDCVSGKWHPDELYEKMFDMVIKFNAFILGVEVTSLEDFIVQPIKNMMRVKGIYPRLEALKAVGKKEDRVATLVPHYRQGYVYHNKNVSTKYESQLMGFPRSKMWDVMDAASYITKILELHDYYFDPPPLEDDLEDEYAELEDEEPILYREAI